jgi:hypothetical protein
MSDEKAYVLYKHVENEASLKLEALAISLGEEEV